jgi:hypothetical protein
MSNWSEYKKLLYTVPGAYVMCDIARSTNYETRAELNNQDRPPIARQEYRIMSELWRYTLNK